MDSSGIQGAVVGEKALFFPKVASTQGGLPTQVPGEPLFSSPSKVFQETEKNLQLQDMTSQVPPSPEEGPGC